jgi:hypothetical protein
MRCSRTKDKHGDGKGGGGECKEGTEKVFKERAGMGGSGGHFYGNRRESHTGADHTHHESPQIYLFVAENAPYCSRQPHIKICLKFERMHIVGLQYEPTEELQG